MATAVMVAMAAATRPIAPTGARAGGGGRKAAADRVSVVLFSIAAFLVVLALLAWQLKPLSAHRASARVVVMKRIYTTTVIETVPGMGSLPPTSMSQSVSSSGSGSAMASPAPTTRSS